MLDVVDVVGCESAVGGGEGVWFSSPAWAPFAVDCAVVVDCSFASRAVLRFVNLRGCRCPIVLVTFGLVLRASRAGLDGGAAGLRADLGARSRHGG